MNFRLATLLVCLFVPLEFGNYLCACKCAESRTFFHLPEQSGGGLSGVHVHRSSHVCYINTGRVLHLCYIVCYINTGWQQEQRNARATSYEIQIV